MRATRVLCLATLGLTGLIILACGGETPALDVPLDPEGGDMEEEDDGEDEGDAEEGDEGGEAEDTAGGELTVDLSAARPAVDTFAAAVDAGDAEVAEQASTEACWSGACKELFDEATGEGMTMTVTRDKTKDDRAIGGADLCVDDDCDSVVLYIAQEGDEWRLAWLDEDEDHARAYLRGKAPAKK